MKFCIACLSLFLFAMQVHAQEPCPVIPMPVYAEKGETSFRFTNTTSVVVTQNSLLPSVRYLKEQLVKLAGIKLAKQPVAGANYIELNLKSKTGNQQPAYNIRMTTRNIVISATDEESLFNGIVSLLQLVAQSPKRTIRQVNCWTINDMPRYQWRGLMLDESRFFFGKETVKKLLDQMAFYKLNRFHWHLTDEPAWRIEIKKYPRLGTEGGKGTYTDPAAPARYYSQDDVREIVAYAKTRFITVIPEIDMPGHATAANKAYPQFSGGGSEKHPAFTFDPGKEETYQYLTDILKEVKILFPSGMIHLGGDEVSFGNERWQTNPGILQLMKDKGLKDVLAVEQYFIRRMADSISNMNNRTLGWDEIVHAGLDPAKTIIFWWRQEKPEQLKEALNKQFPVVLCPRLPFYFDFVQDSTHKKGRKWNRLYNSTEQVYRFSAEQLPVTITDTKLVLGIQANLWTETVQSEKRLEYLLFPRICALAEAAWTTNARKEYKQFERRLEGHFNLFKRAGIYYYDPLHPLQTPEPLQ